MKVRYILTAAVATLVFGLFAIGQNAGNSQDLAAKVTSADNANQSLVGPQKTLADYVHSHMGSSIRLSLDASYQRALVSANATPNTSGQVYHDAQAACVSHTTAVNQANCVQSYVNTHTTPGVEPQPAQISRTPYIYNYTAPRWSPDAAGVAILVGLVGIAASALALVVRPSKRHGAA